MDTELLTIGSNALKKAALNQEAKHFVLSNPKLFQALKKAADRYIGGETLEETVGKVKSGNARGFKCSIEFMGENTSTKEEATAATDEFVQICQAIKNQKLHSTAALDLSHIGLNVSKELCAENLDTVCTEAAKSHIEVIISAEGAEQTDAVLDVYLDASKRHKNVGITLQAYLHRSQDDFKELIKRAGRIRMVKGAFETPMGLSLPRCDKLDVLYLEYVDQLLAQNHICAIATHHDKIQQEAKKLIQKHKSPKEIYEFESLFGIRNELLVQLQEEGHPTKIYFVYGKEWYLYLCNRIAEYPLNIFRALKDIVD